MRPVNLLPESDRPRRRSGESSSTAFVVLGVLGALVMAVSVYVLTLSQVNTRKTEAAEAKREAIESERRAKALGAFGDFSKVKETRLASVTEAARGRFDWERLMRETALVLPSGSWLVSLEASASGQLEGSTGSAPSSSPSTTSSSTPASGSAAGASAAGGAPTAKLVGCARRQPDVATLLVRLRRMHRVEEVTLNQSQRGTAGSSGSGAVTSGGASNAGSTGCGRHYQFDVTVSFKQSAPAEAAEGARKVPSSLGGGE